MKPNMNRMTSPLAVLALLTIGLGGVPTTEAAIGTCTNYEDDWGFGGSNVSCDLPCPKGAFLAVTGFAQDPDAGVSAKYGCGGQGAGCSLAAPSCAGFSKGTTKKADSGTCWADSDEFWSSTVYVACATLGYLPGGPEEDPMDRICRIFPDFPPCEGSGRISCESQARVDCDDPCMAQGSIDCADPEPCGATEAYDCSDPCREDCPEPDPCDLLAATPECTEPCDPDCPGPDPCTMLSADLACNDPCAILPAECGFRVANVAVICIATVPELWTLTATDVVGLFPASLSGADIQGMTSLAYHADRSVLAVQWDSSTGCTATSGTVP